MLNFLADSVLTPILPFFLGTVGIILYIDLRFFPFLKLKTIIKTLFQKSDTSSLRALSVALAGTLGVGNIVGVAYAITQGGAGALFWMWVSAVLAMILKYAETLLAIRFRREVDPKKSLLPAIKEHVGGAMYYIPHRFFSRLFALLCVASSFTVGNLLQTKAVSDAFSESFSLSPYLVGAALALLTFLVIYRGIGRITRFCSIVVPLLSFFYLAMCLTVLAKNLTALPFLFKTVLKDAFSLRAATGGIGTTVMLSALRAGFSKGLVTNEAGCGTAPIAHASSQTDKAVKQGLLGIVEVFFDTIVLCTASGLVFLLALEQSPSLSGYSLVLYAFNTLFGKIAVYIMPICIFFFVLATLVSWSYYGRSALRYFTKNRLILTGYLILFSAVAFFGAIGSAEIFWQLSDVTLGLMALINTGYLLYFRRTLKQETEAYFHNKKG